MKQRAVGRATKVFQMVKWKYSNTPDPLTVNATDASDFHLRTRANTIAPGLGRVAHSFFNTFSHGEAKEQRNDRTALKGEVDANVHTRIPVAPFPNGR